MLYTITHRGQLLAIIIKAGFHETGVHFCSPNEFSQQIAYMRHPAGKAIQAHFHNAVPRNVFYTQETLVLKKGKLRVDLYDAAQQYVESHVLEAGDVILLASGGHGFEVLEEIEMVEVKQGPYPGHIDKTHFSGVPSEQIKIVDE